jgi:hypothetical protein
MRLATNTEVADQWLTIPEARNFDFVGRCLAWAHPHRRHAMARINIPQSVAKNGIHSKEI